MPGNQYESAVQSSVPFGGVNPTSSRAGCLFLSVVHQDYVLVLYAKAFSDREPHSVPVSDRCTVTYLFLLLRLPQFLARFSREFQNIDDVGYASPACDYVFVSLTPSCIVHVGIIVCASEALRFNPKGAGIGTECQNSRTCNQGPGKGFSCSYNTIYQNPFRVSHLGIEPEYPVEEIPWAFARPDK